MSITKKQDIRYFTILVATYSAKGIMQSQKIRVFSSTIAGALFVLGSMLNSATAQTAGGDTILSWRTPVHYPILDHLRSNYQKDSTIYTFCRSQISSKPLEWWELSTLYENLFQSSVRLLLPTTVILDIWKDWVKADKYRANQFVQIQYDFVDQHPEQLKVPPPLICFLLREKSFFEKQNLLLQGELDTEVMGFMLRNEPDLGYATRLIDKSGRYPGRSIVGVDFESWAWTAIYTAPVSILKEYVEMLNAAVHSVDLHPRYLAMTLDKIALSESGKQIYGTIHEDRKDNPGIAPLAYPNQIDSLRHSMGLPIDRNQLITYDLLNFYHVLR